MSSELIEKYRQALIRLLPRGLVWERIRTDEKGFFRAIAKEFARVDGRATDFLLEIDPGTATELIGDWESLLGIPDECSDVQGDLNKRRQQARARLAATIGALNAAYYVNVAKNMGYDAIVTDYLEFKVGRSRVGDRLTNAYEPYRDQFRVGRNRTGDRLKRFGWKFTFEVNTEATLVQQFRVGRDRVGTALQSFENPVLQCTIKKLKPAHTSAYFTFR